MPVRPPSLRAIAAFEAAARHQSFTKAAEELNLTQSAISHAIRSLELRLGVELFTRFGRTVALTEPGRVFVGRLRLSLNLISEAFDVQPKPGGARLTVAAPACLLDRVVAPRLARFIEAWPDIQIELRTQGPDAAPEADLWLAYGTSAGAGCSSRLLARETLFPVAAGDRDAPRRAEDLARAALIHQPEHPWRVWLDQLALGDMVLPAGLTVHDPGAAIACARAGLGVALARSVLVQDDLRTGRLVKLFDAEASLQEGYWAVWNPATAKGHLIQPLVDWLAEDLQVRPRERRPIAQAA